MTACPNQDGPGEMPAPSSPYRYPLLNQSAIQGEADSRGAKGKTSTDALPTHCPGLPKRVNRRKSGARYTSVASAACCAVMVLGFSSGSAAAIVAEASAFAPLPYSVNAYAANESATLAAQAIAIDLERLPQHDAAIGESFRMNLLASADFNAVIDIVTATAPDKYTVAGTLEGDPYAWFVLSRVGDVVVGEVSTSTGEFQVRVSSDGAPYVRKVDVARLRRCGTNRRQAAPISAVTTPRTESLERDVVVSPVVDVMIVYTAEARNAAGGRDAMDALAAAFVETSNQVYVNSLVGARLRLVYSGEVNYAESRLANTDLSRLTAMNDGYLDEVHALRDQYGADMVTLLVNDFDYCGIAWLNYGAARAFSVVDFGCGGLTYTHELGHNQGCVHDRTNSPYPGQFSYSYGHRFYGASGKQWRSVMAYSPGTRIPHLSNPRVTYDGAPTGIADTQSNSADNAKTLTLTTPTIAAYRATRGLNDCNGNFRDDAQDISQGFSDDCNHNDEPDECDIVSAASRDDNRNAVPDECECDSSRCQDNDACTVDTCNPVTDACVHTRGVPYGDLNSSGQVDMDDLLCVLAGFESINTCPGGDIDPCSGNNIIELEDLMAMLAAMEGRPQCTASCP